MLLVLCFKVWWCVAVLATQIFISCLKFPFSCCNSSNKKMLLLISALLNSWQQNFYCCFQKRRRWWCFCSCCCCCRCCFESTSFCGVIVCVIIVRRRRGVIRKGTLSLFLYCFYYGFISRALSSCATRVVSTIIDVVGCLFLQPHHRCCQHKYKWW